MGKLEKIKPNAAGIDIGSEKIFVAIEGQEVKSFNTFTSTLHQAVAYLQDQKVTSVAMEATGVYHEYLAWHLYEQNYLVHHYYHFHPRLGPPSSWPHCDHQLHLYH